jgi:hypothetical protein
MANKSVLLLVSFSLPNTWSRLVILCLRSFNVWHPSCVPYVTSTNCSMQRQHYSSKNEQFALQRNIFGVCITKWKFFLFSIFEIRTPSDPAENTFSQRSSRFSSLLACLFFLDPMGYRAPNNKWLRMMATRNDGESGGYGRFKLPFVNLCRSGGNPWELCLQEEASIGV